MKNERKRLVLIGPIIIDKKSSGGEGEKLFQRLRAEGYTIYKRSGYRNKLLRLFDILYFLIMKRKKYDEVILLIFSGRAFALEYLVLVCAQLLNKPIKGIIHGGAMAGFYKEFPKSVEKVFMKCKVLASPSNYLIQYFLARGYAIEYIPNFIETKDFPSAWVGDNKPRLLWIRAFHDIYNPELAIRCISELKQQFPNLELTMIGPDMGVLLRCKKLIADLNLNHCIHLLGFIPNNELHEFYASHSIFLNTTRYESFGVALIEAASTGIPIVSTRVGEIPYLWKHGEEILLAEEDDQQAFNQQVKNLLLDTLMQRKLSAQASEKAVGYSWNNVRNKWEKLIQS
jgi:glycosyltransferase involved in cell wall biosynthesis